LREDLLFGGGQGLGTGFDKLTVKGELPKRGVEGGKLSLES
jgi:hypothetical protein